MSHDWPIAAAAASGAEPLLPLTLAEHVELALASPALRAFAEQRAVQMQPPFNHMPEADLALGVDELVRMARHRLTAFLDHAGRGLPNLPPERRDTEIRRLAIAGGLLCAAYERCCTIAPEGDQ